MNINETSDFFRRMINESDKKSEIRVYNNFIGVLTALQSKKLSENQLQSIEEKLDSLDLHANPEKKRKYFNQKLISFKKYLKDEFSFISEGFYTAIGMSLGMSFGIAIGASIGQENGISFGLIIGMILGMALGKMKDTQAEKQDRVLKTKMK